MTPTKDQIIERAMELYHEDNWQISDINPTEDELKESGYVSQAMTELMRVNPYVVQIRKGKETERMASLDSETFPMDAILREACFVTGGRGSGKSNLLKLLVSEALAQKVQVKVIDSTLIWKGFPLDTIRVRKPKVLSKWNAIYDTSRLSVLEMRDFAQRMMTLDLEEAIRLTDIGYKPRCLYVIEEVQNVIMPNSLRMLKFQEISRFCTQGRNFGLSYVCSTQRLSSTDTSLVEISGVKYWMKLEGDNNFKKARAWLDKYEAWNLRNLEVGSCYLQLGSKAKFLKLPEFQLERPLVQARG